MANYLKRPNGTEDITPDRVHKWHTVEQVVRTAAANFGFSEIRVPFLLHHVSVLSVRPLTWCKRKCTR